MVLMRSMWVVSMWYFWQNQSLLTAYTMWHKYLIDETLFSTKLWEHVLFVYHKLLSKWLVFSHQRKLDGQNVKIIMKNYWKMDKKNGNKIIFHLHGKRWIESETNSISNLNSVMLFWLWDSSVENQEFKW